MIKLPGVCCKFKTSPCKYLADRWKVIGQQLAMSLIMMSSDLGKICPTKRWPACKKTCTDESQLSDARGSFEEIENPSDMQSCLANNTLDHCTSTIGLMT